MKRLISSLIALCLVIAIFPAASFAATGDITVYIDFEGYNLGQGFYIEPAKMTVPRGTTAGEVTVKILNDLGYDYEASGSTREQATGKGDGFYLSAVADFDTGRINVPEYITYHKGPTTAEARAEGNDDNYLGEFDYSFMSGWCLTVDQDRINRGAGAETLRDGSVIRWQFTLWGYGADLGRDPVDASGRRWSEDPYYNHADKDALVRAIADNPDSPLYQKGLNVLINPLAAQSSVDDMTVAILNGDEEFDGSTDETDINENNDSDPADFRELNRAIARAEALKERYYTDASWSQFIKKLDAAKKIADNSSSKQYQVDVALLQLEDAMDKLEETGSSGSSGGGGGGGGTAQNPASDSTGSQQQTGGTATAFNDVTASDWFSEDVIYAVENNLMNGISDSEFAPKNNITRAMLVTILYRYSDSPNVSGGKEFSDVPAGKWYSDAVNWASSNGIVNGYANGNFGTNDDITREQIAVILYNFAKQKGINTSKTTDLSAYTDWSSASSYARDAMSWAAAEGLILGRTADTLAPKGNATRAEAATLLRRFIEGCVKGQ
ncbi:MAG: S-layer homology domain-containing protein [Oscillospiraceae bacterium]|nr:S-layer homology domain-containing protein [Oscillospiraceae bacterium]